MQTLTRNKLASATNDIALTFDMPAKLPRQLHPAQASSTIDKFVATPLSECGQFLPTLPIDNFADAEWEIGLHEIGHTVCDMTRGIEVHAVALEVHEEADGNAVSMRGVTTSGQRYGRGPNYRGRMVGIVAGHAATFLFAKSAENRARARAWAAGDVRDGDDMVFRSLVTHASSGDETPERVQFCRANAWREAVQELRARGNMVLLLTDELVKRRHLSAVDIAALLGESVYVTAHFKPSERLLAPNVLRWIKRIPTYSDVAGGFRSVNELGADPAAIRTANETAWNAATNGTGSGRPLALAAIQYHSTDVSIGELTRNSAYLNTTSPTDQLAHQAVMWLKGSIDHTDPDEGQPIGSSITRYFDNNGMGMLFRAFGTAYHSSVTNDLSMQVLIGPAPITNSDKPNWPSDPPDGEDKVAACYAIDEVAIIKFDVPGGLTKVTPGEF